MPAVDKIVVLVVLVFILVSLYREYFRPSTIFFIALVILTASGILTPSEALSGFANEQIAVIILLMVLAGIIKKTGLLDSVFYRFFKSAKTYKSFLTRMMIYVAGSSAFLNNTPIVATLVPYVHDWGKRNNISPSKVLMPLSFAAILGGTATLIGTSTNLIVNGMAINTGLESLNIFDFTYVGLPLIVVGILYLRIFGYRLLPDRKDILDSFSEKSRDYIVETQIKKHSGLIGKTIEEADLRDLSGLYLAEIIRDRKTIAPVSPDEILQKDDLLIFAGKPETITDLIRAESGLSFPAISKINKQEKIHVIEVVIPYNSSLTRSTVKESNFRGKYDAAIVAIHRNGEKVSGKIGNISLKAGDILLIVAGEDFNKRTENSEDIYVISKLHEIQDIGFIRSSLILGGTLSAIILAATGVAPLFHSLLVLLCIIAFMGIISLPEIKNNLDVNIVFIAAFAIAIGKALIKTGTADMLANSLLVVFQPLGVIGVLFGIYLVTNIMTEFITNAAAASIVFPISYTTAIHLGVEPVPFVLVVAFAASASFLTPIGYQTNLMVLGPGNYSFKDFTRVGFPLSLTYMVVTCLVLAYHYNLF